MLRGTRVLDLTGEPGRLTGRILADLAADVVMIEPPGGHPDRDERFAFAALNAGKRSVTVDLGSEDGGSALARLTASADVVLETGPVPGEDELRAANPALVWCSIRSFGRTGPKAGWRASDLTVVAQSGNMFCTGDPDRAPLRCTFPTSWYHGCSDAAAGVLAALFARERTGRGDVVDVSLQESVAIANMGRISEYGLSRRRGGRSGALMRVGKTTQREIWRCKDGYASFGLRGGAARIPGLKRLVAWMAEEGHAAPVLTERDWDSYNHNLLTQDEVDEISAPIARFFETKTMTQLYEAALARGLMLAPANTAREILASRQSAARGLFTEVEDPSLGRIPLPRSFVAAEGVPGARAGAPRPGEHTDAVLGEWAPRPRPAAAKGAQGAVFAGLKVLELGSGAAGPLAMRYFADHGATVVRIESRARPDFLRIYALTATQRSLDASPMFAQFNCNKLAITLNLKHPSAREIALRLVRWADLVAENFAPGAMERLGLGWEEIRSANPSAVMLRTCLHGQTGPERDYPGFGGQGSAISGFNHLTGWPDREPVGPYGTITDSLSPKLAAIAAMAALVRRARSSEGARLDVSQVECAVYCLAEVVVEASVRGEPPARLGNRSRLAAPHGVFRCAGDDRWVALAVWTDDDWGRLVDAAGSPGWANGRFTTAAERTANADEIEKRIEEWTSTRDRDVVATLLRAAGLDAAEVLDFEDLDADPQLRHRGHLNLLPHPVLGEHALEALGFRLAASPPEFSRPGPTLGRDNDEVFGGILGIPDTVRTQLAGDGVLA